MAFLTGQSRVLKYWCTGWGQEQGFQRWGQEQGFQRCFTDGVNYEFSSVCGAGGELLSTFKLLIQLYACTM